MKSIHLFQNTFMALCVGAALAPLSASAQNPDYAPGDLVLYFQKDGDSSKAVYARLGNAATAFRGSASGPGAANQTNFLNIKAELDAAFPGGWANDTTIYAGLAAIRSSTAGTTVTDGDPKRTIYISQGRQIPGTVGQASSTSPVVASDTDMSTAGGQMVAMLNKLETLGLDAVEVVATSEVNVKNPINLGVQGTAYATFPGGVQQQSATGSFGSLGAAGNVEFALDLYRILAVDNAAGQVAGTLRQGSYEGTITINANGDVSFISQGASSTPFQAWTLTFPALDTEAKKLPTADPDNDGLSNLMEFVLNGNPGASDSQSIAPVLDASGANFVFSFNRRDDSETGSTLLFEYGSDLTGWTPLTIGAGTNLPTVSVSENTSNPDAIVVTIPKTAAVGGKLFGRLKITQP